MLVLTLSLFSPCPLLPLYKIFAISENVIGDALGYYFTILHICFLFLHLLLCNFSPPNVFAPASRRWCEFFFFQLFYIYNYIIIRNYYYYYYCYYYCIYSNINISHYFLFLIYRVIYFKIVVSNYSLPLKVSIFVLIIWSINYCHKINSNISIKIFQSNRLTRLLKYFIKKKGCYKKYENIY